MALGISATFNSDYNSPGWNIVVTGINTGHNTIRVVAESQDTDWADYAVRGMDEVAITGATMAISDYEMPIGAPYLYRVTTTDLSPVATESTISPVYEITQGVTLNTGFLKSVGTPSLSRKIGIMDLQYSRPARVLGAYNVLGRPAPVVTTDVLGARKGTMSILNWYPDDLESIDPSELEFLFAEGGVLLFQSQNKETTGFDDMYFVLSGEVSPEKVQLAGEYDWPLKKFTFEFTEVDRPATSLLSLDVGSYNDLLDFATYNDVLSARATYLEVLNQPGV